MFLVYFIITYLWVSPEFLLGYKIVLVMKFGTDILVQQLEKQENTLGVFFSSTVFLQGYCCYSDAPDFRGKLEKLIFENNDRLESFF